MEVSTTGNLGSVVQALAAEVKGPGFFHFLLVLVPVVRGFFCLFFTH